MKEIKYYSSFLNGIIDITINLKLKYFFSETYYFFIFIEQLTKLGVSVVEIKSTKKVSMISKEGKY